MAALGQRTPESSSIGIIKRCPEHFHIGLVPDMRTNFAKADVDTDAQANNEAEHAKWQAALRLFKGNLILDQRLVNKMEFGSRALHDILEWNDAEQVRQQCILDKSWAKQFMDHCMPKATASNWSDVPGAVALVVQNIHNLFWRPP